MQSTETSFLIPGAVGQLELLTASGDKNTTAIICHPHPLHGGTMTNKVVHTLAKTFNQFGFNAVRFNFRGIGQSQGEFGNAVGEQEDLQAVIDWVRQQQPNDNIWLAGFSFGSYIAAAKANENDAEQLVMIAPAVHHTPFESLERFQMPARVFMGTQDEIVPPEAVFTWCESRDDIQLIKVDAASHFFHGKLIALRELLEQEFTV